MTVTKLASKDSHELIPMLKKLDPQATGTIKQDFEVGCLNYPSLIESLETMRTLPGVDSLTWDVTGLIFKDIMVYFSGTVEAGIQVFSRLHRMCDAR